MEQESPEEVARAGAAERATARANQLEVRLANVLAGLRDEVERLDGEYDRNQGDYYGEQYADEFKAAADRLRALLETKGDRCAG